MGKDLTKSMETKVQRAVRKIYQHLNVSFINICHLSTSEYRTLYSRGSAPGKFYGTSREHKTSANKTVDEFPLRPIIPNIGRTSYHLPKYLAKTLPPLSKSEYTVNNNLEFISYIKTIYIPSDHKLTSFDVKSLITNVPLNFTIDLILKDLYKDSEIQTNIKKKEMKQLLLLCTQNVHLSNNGVMLAGIFMVYLECTLIPKLPEHMNSWKKYVDDIISIIKETSIAHVLKVLINFYKNIEFTYDMEENGKVEFLDVLIIRNNNTFKKTVYRKKIRNGVYLHWEPFVPLTWTRSTLLSTIIRAYRICPTQEYLEPKLLKTKHEFTQISGYPKWLLDKIIEESKLSGNFKITPTIIVTSTGT